MADRQFRPGYRGPGGRKMGNDPSRITDNRIAWLDYGAHKILIMRYENGDPEGEDGVGESGPNHVLFFKQAGRRPLSINLGSLTEREIDLMREVFNLALDLAKPVAAQRDEVAKEAASAGDDSYARFYRPVPRLVVREAIQPDDEGVHDGPSDLPEGDGGDVDPAPGGLRGAGIVLAPGAPGEVGSKDDTPSSD